MRRVCLRSRIGMRSGSRVARRIEPFCRRSSRKTHRTYAPGIPDRRQKGFCTSIRVMLAVIADHQTKGGERLLLLCLARYAGDDGGRVFPSVETLCADTQQVRRAVQYQLRKLETKGLIERVGATYTGTANYRILLHRLRPAPAQKQAKMGASESAASAPRAPDMSIESSKIRQEPVETAQVKPASSYAVEAVRKLLKNRNSAPQETK